MTNNSFLAHSEPLFKLLNILKVKDVHRLVLGQYMFKQTRGGGMQPGATHDYGTRGQLNVRPAFQRLSLTQHSIYYAGPLAWNTLPSYVKDSKTIDLFKKQIKEYIINGYHES